MTKFRLLCFSVCALLLLVSGASSYAETFTVAVSVVNGDIVKARKDAWHEIFYDAAIASGVELKSAALSINQRYFESSLLSSRVKLRQVQIVKEEVKNGVLTISANIEVAGLEAPDCRQGAWARNTKVRWKIGATPIADPNQYDGLQMFGQALEKSFSAKLPALMPTEKEGGASVFEVLVSFDSSASARGVGVSILSPGGAVLKAFSYPMDPRRITMRQEEAFANARLIKSVLRPATLLQIEKISSDVVAALHCFPLIVRVPADRSTDDLLKVSLIQVPPDSQLSLALYFETFPMMADQSIDLLAIKDVFPVEQVSPEGVFIKLPPQAKGRQAPLSSQGYLLLR